MIRKVLPHPYLTVLLTATWLLLANRFSLNGLLLGLFLGIVIPILTEPFWPDRPKLKKPLLIVIYFVIVIWDIIVANVVVALTILFKRNAAMQPHWICIPLELKTPEAITILAGTITLTPGTVTADLSDRGASLLVHCLDTADPDGDRDTIKRRYERRLKEIFE